MFYLQLIQNVALLVSLVVIHGLIMRRWSKDTFSSKVLSGFLFGCVAVIGIVTRVYLTPGVIFDGRSIILSVAGFFGGPVVGGVAAGMTVAYRMWLGGPGAFVGVCVVLGSAGLGVIFYYLRRHHPELTRNIYLFAFGLLVQVGRLLLMLMLPEEGILEILGGMAIPFFLIFPTATWLICLLFLDQESHMSAEEDIRESEKRYKTVADFTYDWEYWIDAEGNFFYCSPSCERITGYSAKEFISDPDLMNRIIHPDDRNGMTDHYHNVRKVAPNAVDAMDFRIIRRDGETRWIGHVCHPVYDQEGQPLGRRANNRDITERKEAEELIKLNEKRLQSLYDISQYRAKNVQELLDVTLEQTIILTGSKFGYMHYYDENTQIFTLNSWSKDVMKACEVAEYQYTWKLEEAGLWGEAVRQKTAIIVNDFQTPDPLKKGYPEGHVALIRFMTVPIFQEDKIVAVVGVANKKSDYNDPDIRQLSLLMDSVWRMMEVMRVTEREHLLVAAIEHAAEGIIITDATGIIEYVNPAQEILSGYSRDELLGQTPNIFKSDFHDDNFYEILWETINAGNVWTGRFINKKKDGTEYHEDATISPVYDKSGNLTNFVALKHDVTEQVELQKQFYQAQKMEAVGTLAGGVAHDFNNLLQAITGYTELLMMRKRQGDSELDDLQKILDSSKRGADLVKSLMLFSRRAQPELLPVDLNHEIFEVHKLLSHTIPKTIKIVLRLSGERETVLADPSQIGQVLMNLGVNARDAMPDGGTLTIETTSVHLDMDYCAVHPEAEPGTYVSLTVSDTGHGMDKHTLEHLFVPFFTTKEPGKGTGLGLATVYGIVKEHKGHITCYSELGLGTTFKIYLPAIQTEKTSEPQKDELPIQGGTETILLVDDEESLRIMGSRHLNQQGYQVITASNGKEALEIYQREGESISLIILDLLMPVMDGWQCLTETLRIDPKAKVIIASGYIDSILAKGMQAKGAMGFVQKPFNTSQLLNTIREILDKDNSGPIAS